MLSLDTERKIAEIFLNISIFERLVEENRYHLCKNADSDPYSIFNALDLLDMNSLSSTELQNFLQKHHIFCSNDEGYLVIKQYDSNLDGRLSLEEFCQFILPSTNSSLREVSIARRGIFTAEVEYLFERLLQAEINFHRNLEILKREVVLKNDFNLLEAFRCIDIKNISCIDRNSLTVFLRKYECISDDDIDSILRRIDNDGDGVVSYTEFIDTVMPSRSSTCKAYRKNSLDQGAQEYRNSSPLRAINASQLPFTRQSQLKSRNSSKEVYKSSTLRESLNNSQKHSSPLKPSILREKNFRNPNYGATSNYERQVSPRYSSPL